MSYINVQRMLTGALLDPGYREQVVCDPFQAAAEGFNGEIIVLEAEEANFFRENHGDSYGTLVVKAAYRVLQQEAARLATGTVSRVPSMLK
jgi:hypothetical protein